MIPPAPAPTPLLLTDVAALGRAASFLRREPIADAVDAPPV